MAYIVTAFELDNINFAPKTVVEEVLQNVAILLSTPKYTVPLDRNLGLTQAFIDKPMPIAEALLVSDLMDALEDYEPRAKVLEVTFSHDHAHGRLTPRVEVNIDEG